MKVQVLISTMNINNVLNFKKLIDKMNLVKKNILLINQCPNNKKDELFNYNCDNAYIYSYNERGLSKSRNKALKKSDSDICLIADDDLEYVKDYEKTVRDAYKKFPNADLIVFYIEKCKKIDTFKEGRLNLLHTLKVCSVQISFKRKSIIDNNIMFDEYFGAGCDYFAHGEENIFLRDCIKKGLKIYYYPKKIAILNEVGSTWFKGIDEHYMVSTGALFYRISKKMYPFLILQYAIRKKKLYKNNFGIFKAFNFMMCGVKQEKQILKRWCKK